MNKAVSALVIVFASGFGSGYSPVASGTAGSLLAALIYWFLLPQSPVLFWSLAAVLAALSVPVSTAAERRYGAKDDGRIVIDEFVGLWVAVAFLPHSLVVVTAAFFLFRFFDVWKPFFVRRLQGLPGGWGVVADDVAAGVFANLVLQAARLFLYLG